MQLFWVFVVGGMCTGAAALHHAHLPTALAFILPAGAPIALRFAAEGSEWGLARAAMIIVFLAALGVSGVRGSAYFGETVRLRLDLARRTRELDAANARLLAEIAEHRATEASLRHAQKMEAVGQLAGGVAHDFNNVLQAVSGGATLIRRRSRASAVERLAGMIADAARRGESVTRRLLAFARRGELRAEAIDLAELLAGLREVLAAALGPAVRVEVDAAAGLLPVQADRGQLETALVNLATNSRDAMPGGGTLTLSAAADRIREGQAKGAGPPAPGDYVRLIVADTGTGMDAETLARASEPFFTTKAQGRGTGLGLAMARSFAEGSGGALAIDSEPGRGTSVSIWLPVAGGGVALAAAAPNLPRDERAPEVGQLGAHASILLVDDEPAVREVLAQQLADEGYDVEQAADGAAALTRLDDRGAVAFDLLVADLAMPGLDGVAVIREARRRRPGLPAILFTGYAGDAAALAVGGALDHGGAFALLRKPITGAGLADQVAALLSVPRGASHEDGALASNHSRVAGGPADAGPAP